MIAWADMKRRFGPGGLLAPGVIYLFLVFVIPIGLLLSRSLWDPELTFEHYRRLIEVPQYLDVFWISFEIALVSTLVSLLLGYPLAYVVTIATPGWRAFLTAIILLPFWTNILVRCYAWMLILQHRGLVNRALTEWLGILGEPLSLVYNYTGVIIGMVHFLLPPMVLILYSVMKTIDMRLVEAAEGLGANPLRAFAHVFVPLSIPGIQAASTLVFILALGFFVTPALLGGQSEVTVSMLINQQFSELLNWGFGAALAVTLFAVTIACLLVFHRSSKTRLAEA